MEEEYVIESKDYRGFQIEIVADSNITSPREDRDNPGTFILWSGHYQNPDSDAYNTNLNSKEAFLDWLCSYDPEWGHKLPNGRYETEDYYTNDDYFKYRGRWYPIERLEEIQWKEVEREYVILGVDLIDYGGGSIKYRVGELNLDADGYIYVSKEKVIEEYGDFTKKSRELAERNLRYEVNDYNSWANGNIAGYRILKADGEVLESVWGYYPETEKRDEFEYVMKEAQSDVDCYINATLKKYFKNTRVGEFLFADNKGGQNNAKN